MIDERERPSSTMDERYETTKQQHACRQRRVRCIIKHDSNNDIGALELNRHTTTFKLGQRNKIHIMKRLDSRAMNTVEHTTVQIRWRYDTQKHLILHAYVHSKQLDNCQCPAPVGSSFVRTPLAERAQASATTWFISHLTLFWPI